MKITDAVTDRIRQRREKLERAGAIKPEFDGPPSTLHLWQVDANSLVVPLGEPWPIPGLDIVIIPSGKFLPSRFHSPEEGDALPQEPVALFETVVEWSNSCGDCLHLPDRRIRLADAPDNPLPPPEQTAEVIVFPTTAEPVEVDRDAVVLNLEKHRAKQPDKSIKERAREALAAYRASHKPQEVTVEEPTAEPQPARAIAFAPQWRPSP